LFLTGGFLAQGVVVLFAGFAIAVAFASRPGAGTILVYISHVSVPSVQILCKRARIAPQRQEFIRNYDVDNRAIRQSTASRTGE